MEPVNEISLEGFKVISGDYFCAPIRIPEPMLTIWGTSIRFSKQDLTLLNACENVLVKINIEERKVLIIPTTSNDKDAVRWIRKLDPLEARKITCPKLTDSLYSAWSWDKDYIYRAAGKLVTAGNKVMLLFDFLSPEKWKRPEAKQV